MKAAIYPKIIDNKESTLILGSFESIHNGHLELIKKAKEYKLSIAMMIIMNPSKLPTASKELYADIETRLQNIASLGIKKVSVVDFDENIRLLSGKEFISNIIKATNAKHLVVGHDFACGINREYRAIDIKNDFAASIVPQYKINNQKLGTSMLKEMVKVGEVNLIKKMSPFPYIITRNVDTNNDFNFDNIIKPHAGIYVVDAIVNNIRFWGYLHVNIDGLAKLKLYDFNLINHEYEAKIAFHKLSRIIISKNHDKVTQSDIERIEQYLNS